MNTQLTLEIEKIMEMLKDESTCDYQFLLQWAIDHDDGVSEDVMPHVVDCYEACARKGMPAAIHNLGALYYIGRFVPQSYEMAESLYLEAIEKGCYSGYCNLGYIYYYGRTGEPDYRKAHECFSLGALLNGDGNCYYKLGDMYRSGLYADKNESLAFQMYLRAAHGEQTYLQEYYSDVCLRLGECFLCGIGTDKNRDGAIHYLNAAREGYGKRCDGDPYGYTQKNIKKLNHLLHELFKKLDEGTDDPGASQRIKL